MGRHRGPLGNAALLGLVVVGVLVFFRGMAVKAPPRPAEPVLTVPNYDDPESARVPPMRASPPVRLSIPRIGVSTTLLPLSLTPEGALEVPALSKADRAGWFRDGPTPGERGSAVIAGHVDSERDKGVFYRLGELRPGQLITVTRRDGTAPVFRIHTIKNVTKSDFPGSEVYGPARYSALRLITCGGTFDAATGHYTENLIVYASLYRPPAPGT
ncbi:class F sortase [Actinocorallia longicatena]|uniref:Class F sortase n=1 Tax=Actinocorallia longicatena TaxID=111803 RepID=A0ABP6QD24_9ACTN